LAVVVLGHAPAAFVDEAVVPPAEEGEVVEIGLAAVEPVDQPIVVAGQGFWAHWFSLTAAVIRRGIDRGELPPDTDIVFLIEVLIAPLYLRLLVTGQTLTIEYADRVVDWVIASARANAA
jgi:hypothetical protein